MEQFSLLTGDQTLKASREPLNNALLTVRSLSSGTAFPTTNLSVGMLCYRTDQHKLYQLADEVTQTWTDALAANIAGNAASASSVAWSNVNDRPSAYPPETHTHAYAGASQSGGAATSATKLATARTINGVAFDGSADITLTMPWANVTDKPSSYASADKLSTARTINGVSFDGTSDITIAVPATPKAYLTAVYQNGALWYRKYSDGWIEQGGQYTAGSTITFPLPFADTNYTAVATINDWGGNYANAAMIGSLTTTGCMLKSSNNASGWGTHLTSVYACGKGAS